MATHWTSKEVRRLKKLFRDGSSDEEIGEALGREVGGVTYKRNDLGLHRRSPPGGGRRGKRSGRRRAAVASESVVTDSDHPYAIIIRGPHRELAMAVDLETGQAVLQLMLGVTD